jgi:collagenase-like PrtC family protease
MAHAIVDPVTISRKPLSDTILRCNFCVIRDVVYGDLCFAFIARFFFSSHLQLGFSRAGRH